MPASLEARRLAVAEALRVVAREPLAAPPASPPPAVPVAPPAAAAPVAPPPPAVDVRAVQERLDMLSGQICEVLTRLGSVETAVLESVWERPEPEPAGAPVEPYVDETAAAAGDETAAGPAGENEPVELVGDLGDDERVSVPAVPLGEVKMSSIASRALFGG